jgi:hypothetical protein
MDFVPEESAINTMSIEVRPVLGIRTLPARNM